MSRFGLKLIYCLFVIFTVNSLTTAHAMNQDADGAQQANEENQAAETKPATKQENEQTSDDSETKPAALSRSDIKIVAPPEAMAIEKSDLNHYLPKQSLESILVGPDDYTVLIETNATANNKGVIILLPDWQQHATSPKAINYLRQAMPLQGWTTISIQPPPKPESYPSIALEATQRLEENQKALSQYMEQLAKILNAVTEKAKSYPGIIVMISEGHHAAILFSIYQQQLVESPMAYISLSGFLSDNESNQLSAQHLAQIDVPVLDLSLKTDHSIIKASVKLRKKLVNQELKSYFRQKELFNIYTGFYPEAMLSKEIIGWLKSLGW